MVEEGRRQLLGNRSCELDKCLVEVSTIRNPYEANRPVCRCSRVQQMIVLQHVGLAEFNPQTRGWVHHDSHRCFIAWLSNRVAEPDSQLTRPTRSLGLDFHFNTDHSAVVFNNGKSQQVRLHEDRFAFRSIMR